MKPALPICIPSLPDTTASPALWRQIAPILNAVHRSTGKLTLEIAVAQRQASKNQWNLLWQYLIERQILSIGSEVLSLQKPVFAHPIAPRSSEIPPKIPPNQFEPLPLLKQVETKRVKTKKVRTKKVRTIATPQPKPVKSPRPINPCKNKAAKVAKPKRKKKRKPRTLTYFAALRATLIRLRVFLWFCGFVAFSAPLCPRAKQGLPLRDRPRGERIKALLSYRTTGGFASLKVYLPSSKTRYKMGTNTKQFLLEWCNARREASPALLKANRLKGLNNRLISPEQLNQALSDKWRDTAVIAAKLTDITGIKFTPTHVSKILSNRLRAGEVFQHSIGNHDVVYYSRIQATEFESEWITQEAAYQIALSRGCTAAKNTFRKHHRFDYSVYGLEFREEVPESENRFMRWRDIQS